MFAKRPEIKDMGIKDMRSELESYGISTRTFLEKKEFLDALEKARDEFEEMMPTSTQRSVQAGTRRRAHDTKATPRSPQTTPPPQQSQQQPVVIVGPTQAALGADLALSAFDILTNNQQAQGARQPVSLIKHEDFQPFALQNHLRELESQYGSKPILHMTVEPGAPLDFLTPEIRNGISFLGLHLTTPAPPATMGLQTSVVAPESARQCALGLEKVLDWCRNGDPIQNGAVVSLHVALHLSFLQGNCLPKSPDVLGDSFHVLLPHYDGGGAVLVDYQYDYATTFGAGVDPLSCPTREVVVSTSPDGVPSAPPTHRQMAINTNAVSAGAYSALRGKRMDPVSCASVAASVASLSHVPPSAALTGQMVELSRQVRKSGTTNSPGILRQKYHQFGYN